MARSTSSETAAGYYRREIRAFPRQARYSLRLPYAAALADELLDMLGEPPVRYLLVPTFGTGRTYHACCPSRRIIEFRGQVSVLDVIHEVAHLATLDHDAHHATTVALLVAMIEARREEA